MSRSTKHKPNHMRDAAEGKSKGTSWTRVLVITVGTLLFVSTGFAATVLPKLIAERKYGNEAAAIGALKTITTAQSLFREGDKEMDTNFDYGYLAELSETQLIDGILGSGTKQGYVFTCAPSPTTSEFLWFASASPADPGSTGDRYFGVNQSGVVFYSLTKPITSDETCKIPTGHTAPVGRPLPGTER